MLSQLVYVSVRNASCTDEEIQKILEACKRNNKELDVTGVLLYSSTHFVQYLEGEFNKITSLYDKIKMDSRHKNSIMINTAPIKERSFPSWQMGAKKFDNYEIEYQTELSITDQKAFKSLLTGKNEGNQITIDLIKKFFK